MFCFEMYEESQPQNLYPTEPESHPIELTTPVDKSQTPPQDQAQSQKLELAQVVKFTQPPDLHDNVAPSGAAESIPSTIPFKRPRGRPRKDGTMPRPRNLTTQPAKKVSVAPSAAPNNGSEPVAPAEDPQQSAPSAGCSPTFVGIAVSTKAPTSETEIAASQAATAAAAAVEAARNAASEITAQPDKPTPSALGDDLATAETAVTEAGATTMPTETAVGDIMDPPLPTTGMSDVLSTANI